MAINVNSRVPVSAGSMRGYIYDIAAGWADADVLDTPLKRVRDVTLQCTDANIAAADAFAAETKREASALNANQVRLQLIGTARRIQLKVLGY